MTCLPVGDMALTVVFEQKIAENINRRVVEMASRLAKRPVKGVVEIVPAYASLTIYYDPLIISYQEMVERLHELDHMSGEYEEKQRIVTFPALYGGEQGPDLNDVADHHGLTPQQVIDLHTSALYRVYMLGFSPGFPYLGGLPRQLSTPRLDTPRLHIPAGAIGIAGSQTGIYSIDSPGGWRIIAHTPVPLFRLDEDPPFLLRVGDLVRFMPVTDEEYQEIVQQVNHGTYQPQIVDHTGKEVNGS
ncbi:MAG: 5-oxoprolinase subunit PxpB [Brevibacillus sp.]|nr:5-oxoprolinase subunit PxpB [Brevibacillus sp.]